MGKDNLSKTELSKLETEREELVAKIAAHAKKEDKKKQPQKTNKTLPGKTTPVHSPLYAGFIYRFLNKQFFNLKITSWLRQTVPPLIMTKPKSFSK